MRDFNVGDIVKGKRCNGYSYTNDNMIEAEVIDVIPFYGSMIIKVKKHTNNIYVGTKVKVDNDSSKFELISKNQEDDKMKVSKNSTVEVNSDSVTLSVKSDKPAFNTKMIKDIKRNGIATIVFWKDGTKTVVKANDEDLDEEKALSMAIVKKMSGNDFNYYKVFQKWCNNASKVK